ncbi:hypothetical protein ACFQV8_26010 [Pseudonocardia benzenivorans]
MTAGNTANPYLRRVDTDALAATGAGERFSQNLIGQATGAQSCHVDWIRTPAGGGSPRACTCTRWTRCSGCSRAR